MAGTTGIATTFDLPNYHGELFSLSPAETPLLSASGGLGGGKQSDSTTAEWQAYDLRDAGSRPRLEGADAPTAEERVRAKVENTLQIFHEAVSTSYTKAATAAMYRTAGSAPFNSGSGAPNPVTNEHSWQVMQSLKQIARDVNYCFWNGVRVNPTTNGTARAMGGLISVATTNAQVKKAALTGISSSTDVLTVTHDLAADDKFVFTDIGASTAVVTGRAYWVKSVSTTASFKISATQGGAAIAVGTATVAGYPLKAANVVSTDDVDGLIQAAFDSGGITDQATATLFVNSGLKRGVTKAYRDASDGTALLGGTRNVGGVAVDTIITDFGTLNITIDRALPQDAIAVVSMEQVHPVLLSIPDKGVLFEEGLAKTGSSDKTQIYGEIGLEYGNEAAHGVKRGFFA